MNAQNTSSAAEASSSNGILHRSLLQARTHWLAWTLAPSLAFFILKVSHNVLLQAGGVDAYIYTSYIQNYADLIHRYGLSYYSTRLAHIFPAGLVVAIFGTELGYFVYRYLLLVAALAAVWILTKRYYSTAAAFFVVTFAGCHPWLLRSLFWDLYDSSGVVYLLLTTALLGTAAPTNRRRIFLAGGTYALASDCNTFLLGVGLMLFVSYLLSYLPFSPRKWIGVIAVSFSGFIVFYLPFCAIHYYRFPEEGFFFDLHVLVLAKAMLTGLGKQWHFDTPQLLRSGWFHLLTPAAVLAATGTMLATRSVKQKTAVLHAVLNLALVIAVYLVVDFVFKCAVIGLFYYFIYLFPSTIFCVAMVVGETAEGGAKSIRRVILGVCGSLCVIAYASYPRWSPWILHSNRAWLSLLVLLAISGAALLGRRSIVGLAVAALAFAASPIPFYLMPTGIYSAIHDGSPDVEWDVYRAGIELQHAVSHYPPSSGAVTFWYTNRNESLLNSVQSIYLWGFSRLAAPTDPKAGMPVLTKEDLARLHAFRYIALLGENDSEIDQGRQALNAAGIRTEPRGRASYSGKSFNMRCLILDRLSGGNAQAVKQ